MGIFGNIFGGTSKNDLKEKIKAGALLIDVRTKEEFRSGHVEGAVNIPLDVLSGKASKLKKDVPIVTVCQSGMRSSTATSILRNKGFEAYNGGCWNNFL